MKPDTMKPITTTEKKTKTAKPTEEKFKVLEVSGLCVSCVTAETCIYRKGSTQAIQYCEEFSDTGTAVQTKLRHVPPQITPREDYKSETGLKGLCVNCDHRSTCLDAKAESGVWHCENYQ